MNNFNHIEIISDDMVEILRRKTPLERLAIGERMFQQARQLIVTSIRNTHPELSDQEVNREVVRRMHRVELPE
ncbi:MAG: hypothetical protein NT138_09155 [Planctomycetales bacterium]|jgi:hypothetical protein|nr:hypothetical protein [Planctomycetales bacterium]